jgi:hypothetical protein
MNTFHHQQHDFPFPDRGQRSPDPGAPASNGASSVPLISYLDVVLIVVAAPIMLLIGVPAAGYAIGGGAWIVLRTVGVLVERALAGRDARTQISARMGYMLGRLFALALAVVLARQTAKDDGLTALLVIVFVFTVQLGTSAMNRPRSR